VRLPAAKTIVVDAKTPLDGYLQAIEASDEQARKARLADHARQSGAGGVGARGLRAGGGSSG
jgi:DNA anti-recombination protein RmuC